MNDDASEHPSHYLVANLDDSYPYVFVRGQMGDGKLLKDVNFIIRGITPGLYRLKVVWDKAAPFAPENKVVYQPEAGDYESLTSPLISILKGVTMDGLRLVCNHLVKK